YLENFVPVFLGNAVGGSIFIAMAYWHAYKKKERTVTEPKVIHPMMKSGVR
ncbi:formate/nitrite transporter, partial [Neobacillus drentensis]